MSIGAGRLNKQITIIRAIETVADSGAVSTAWGVLLKVRAELVENHVTEEAEGFGEHEAGSTLFRIRYSPLLSTADRIIHSDGLYGIDALNPSHRNRWLEMKATLISREIPAHDTPLPPSPPDDNCLPTGGTLSSAQW